ncbi:hypothetical protein A176_003302 [Myxococcus hansupus]|uniref:Uncharacterized protein n=1 Tax=Pseudomyxococcus hansupus TaxID=1297742 RepID=A0A0H4WYF9_9BACT|nr:hypothetical protein [Myxococcus hansupus]AKQ66390.1 hypothetical protein A176_003302 [Myxococcus hansupus]
MDAKNRYRNSGSMIVHGIGAGAVSARIPASPELAARQQAPREDIRYFDARGLRIMLRSNVSRQDLERLCDAVQPLSSQGV